jgi:hypothetical protein
MHGAEGQERVVDAVVGQDRDRALGPQVAVEQRLADAPYRAVGFAVSNGLPSA